MSTSFKNMYFWSYNRSKAINKIKALYFYELVIAICQVLYYIRICSCNIFSSYTGWLVGCINKKSTNY